MKVLIRGINDTLALVAIARCDKAYREYDL